jgi:hypothetical protein
MESLDIVRLCDATAALVRLDERLGASRDPVRTGWLARALLHEAAASARLDEVFVESRDLLLFEHDLLLRLSDHDVLAAHRGLVFLRAAARRDPRQLFTTRRLMAAARMRLRGRPIEAGGPLWLRERLEERRVDPEELRASASRALDPLALQTFRLAPALVGAAGFLARWHETGAGGAIGGTVGRGLAAAWLRRTDLLRHPAALPASGFLGHAAEYDARSGERWTNAFLAAAQRGADWGLALIGRLERADRVLREELAVKRSTSRLPQAADLLLASPGVTVAGMARALSVTDTAARGLLRRIEARHPLTELTGRESFRLFALV